MRGNRLLGIKEIHERLDETDVQREEVERAVEELEQEGAIIAVRGKRYSLLEFTPYHAGSIKVYNDGHGNVLGARGEGRDEPDVYIDRRSMKGAMNGDVVVVRVDKHDAKRRSKPPWQTLLRSQHAVHAQVEERVRHRAAHCAQHIDAHCRRPSRRCKQNVPCTRQHHEQ